MSDEEVDELFMKLANIGIATGLVLLGAGIGCAIGYMAKSNRYYEDLTSLLRDAVNDGTAELFWDNNEGTKSRKFLIKFIEEVDL